MARINSYEKNKLPQFQALLSKGLSPAQANRIVKLQSATLPDERKGLRPEVANRYARRFTSQRDRSAAGFPTRRSDWLRSTLAAQSQFRSPIGNRYLLDFTFRAYNTKTGEFETISNTFGMETVDRWGRIQDDIQEQIMGLFDNQERYQLLDYQFPDLESIQIKGFYRTLNP